MTTIETPAAGPGRGASTATRYFLASAAVTFAAALWGLRALGASWWMAIPVAAIGAIYLALILVGMGSPIPTSIDWREISIEHPELPEDVREEIRSAAGPLARLGFEVTGLMRARHPASDLYTWVADHPATRETAMVGASRIAIEDRVSLDTQLSFTTRTHDARVLVTACAPRAPLEMENRWTVNLPSVRDAERLYRVHRYLTAAAGEPVAPDGSLRERADRHTGEVLEAALRGGYVRRSGDGVRPTLKRALMVVFSTIPPGRQLVGLARGIRERRLLARVAAAHAAG